MIEIQKKSMIKLILLALVTISLILGVVTFLEISKNKHSLNMAKLGLEQCVSDPSQKYSKIIWVKSCIEYSNVWKDFD